MVDPEISQPPLGQSGWIQNGIYDRLPKIHDISLSRGMTFQVQWCGKKNTGKTL